jgi:penicillin-binding protein 1A
VQELVLARRLEHALSKRQILELYLNEIYLGHGRYGVEEASRCYFGKGVEDIDLGQAAVLAALPKAPSRDSPFRNPERAKERQVYVLEQMVAHGFATARDARRHIDEPLDLAEAEACDAVERGASEFVDLVREELERRYGADALETLGAVVTTTVDLDLQHAAHEGLMQGLVALDRRRSYGHGIRPARAANLRRAREEGEGPLEVGEVHYVVIEERPADVELPREGFAGKIGDHPVFVHVPRGSRYDDPELGYDEQFPPGGITRARVLGLPAEADAGELPAGWAAAEVGSGPEAAFVVADVATGEVLAMIGGSEYGLGEFNRVRSARRQPGSAFKPFVYGAALRSRKFTAASIVSDSPEIYEKWRPTNFEPDVYRGDIRVREALAHSVNTVAIKLLDSVGVEAVHEFARAAGIESPLVDNLSLALGTSEVTPLELLRGYMTLARGGSRILPSFIRRIDVPRAEPWEPEPEPEQTLEPDVTFVLTSLLESVISEGTGRAAASLGRPAAGKTGTSADFHDAWFAGYTPRHVAVAWVGFDRPRRIGRGETGGRAALPIWLHAMKAAEADEPPGSFVPPPSVTVRTIDARSGLLVPTGPVSGDQPTDMAAIEEYFLEGTEPIDEVVAGALPASDVLLDLYGTAGSETGEERSATDVDAPADPDAPEDAPADVDAPRVPPRGAPREPGLPSLDREEPGMGALPGAGTTTR